MTTDQTPDGNVNVRRSGTLRGETLRPTGKAPPLPHGYDVQQLWYRLLSRPWSCLVVVSPDQTPNTQQLARSLAEFGTLHQRRPVEFVDAQQLDLERAAAIAHMVQPEAGARRLAEARFVIALDSPIVNPTAIEVLTAGDAVLLLLEKGVTRVPQARKIIEIAGRERLVGAVLASG
jgi:hypothetical protein